MKMSSIVIKEIKFTLHHESFSHQLEWLKFKRLTNIKAGDEQLEHIYC